MRILVDMDGVLSDFDGEFLKRWRIRHPNKLYVPMQQRTSFYVRDSYPDDLRSLVTEILLEPDFFRHMLPVEGGREALFEMQVMGLKYLFVRVLYRHTGTASWRNLNGWTGCWDRIG